MEFNEIKELNNLKSKIQDVLFTFKKVKHKLQEFNESFDLQRNVINQSILEVDKLIGKKVDEGNKKG